MNRIFARQDRNGNKRKRDDKGFVKMRTSESGEVR
jgi:hypothetical protein